MFSKHVLGPLVILVRLMPVLLSMPQRGDLCPQFEISNPPIVKHINHTSGTEHCCKQILCTAGTEVQYCSLNDPNNTACRKCSHGYYNKDAHYSHQNPTCIQWKRCSRRLGLVSNNDGSTTFEGTCRCNVAMGYYDYNEMDRRCKKRRKSCDPNHELDPKTGDCVPCRLGHEQLVSGYGPCRPCPIGTYRSSLEQLNCTVCPAGLHTVKPGQHKCSMCKELVEANMLDLPCDPGDEQTILPKSRPSTEDDGSSNNIALTVIVPVVFVLLAIILIVGLVVWHKRRQTKKREMKRKSPVHSPSPAGTGYRAVSGSSTSSSDNASHSSADDALEAEKIRAQNQMNQGVSMVNEKPCIPQGDLNTDAAGQPAGQTPLSGAPPAAFQDHERFLIMNPSNCNITVGARNQVSMVPVPPSDPPPPGGPPPTEEPHRQLNTPRSRQSAPPTVDLSQGYNNQMVPPYYEDEVDRLAMHYNGPSNC